ncbi:MAG: efflux RND transporter periplasmic adaptor subunit [Bacteroidetes bacterium]|nr:efflux RND transporter periplasmic adaptor subunit [Bacteroidota bacterium]
MAQTKSRKKAIIVISLIVIVLGVVIGFALFGKEDKGMTVTVEPVQKRTITQVVTASGKIYPELEVKMSPDVSGEVVRLAVKEGQEVRKGDFLAEIRPDIYQFQVDQSQAALQAVTSQYEKAKKEFERIDGLHKKNLVSDSEIEQVRVSMQVAESDLQRTKSNLEQAQESLRKTRVVAPITGIVSSLSVEEGERVVGTSQFSGTEMMRIADFSRMEVKVDVNENDVVNVSLGDTARISVDAIKGKTFNGIVKEIAHSPVTTGLGTQEQVTNFPVTILLIDESNLFRSGMSATADIETDRVVNALSVPIQSVTIRRDQLAMKPEGGKDEEAPQPKPDAQKSAKSSLLKTPPKLVFVADSGKARSVVVETGISDDRYIEIKSGLTGAEQVVSGSYRAISKDLQNGTKVRIEDTEKKKAGGEAKEESED